MQTLTATEDQLRLIIREEISNILKKEFMKLRLMLMPEISREEKRRELIDAARNTAPSCPPPLVPKN